MAGIAVVDLPESAVASGGARRVGIVEYQQAAAVGLAAILSQYPDLAVVAIAPTVPALLEQTTELSLVVLDPVLPEGSSARATVELLHDKDIPCLVYTTADRHELIRDATPGGALGIALKSDPIEQTVAMIRALAYGRADAGATWASARDSDVPTGVNLPPRQREVLEHYAGGETAASVAHRLGLSEHTVNDYLNRIRRRYAEAGRPVHTRVDLYREARKDGIIGDDSRSR